MIKQTLPKIDKSAMEIYKECVNSFRDEKKRQRLYKYTDLVEKSDQDYKRCIPFDFEHFEKYSIEPNDKEDLISVYSKKFSNSKFDKMKPIYDLIRISSNGKCAICNTQVASNLDHYLPKSVYPLLCVNPNNLVPECRDCNQNKRAYLPGSNNQMLLHPYIDDFSTIKWLDVKIDFSDLLNIKYYNSYSEVEEIANRFNQTIKIYKLDTLFAVQANSEIENNLFMWKKVLKESSQSQLYKYIEGAKESAEHIDLNSWKAALYRALYNQFGEFVEWIDK